MNQRPRVLLIEDEPDDQDTFCEVLSDVGDCDVAGTDDQARARLEKQSYDLIVLDLAMDRQSLDPARQLFMQELKSRHSAVPILGISGKNLTAADGFAASKYGVTEFRCKADVEIEALRDVARRLISRARQGTVFISYARSDKAWCDRVVAGLRPYEYATRMSLWVDRSSIPTGAEWEGHIRDAIARATTAVLLLSNAYLSSEFIRKQEVPAILHERQRGLCVAWFCIEPCAYETLRELTKVHAVHDPDDPLSLEPCSQQRKLVEICRKIHVATRGALEPT